MKNPSFRQMVIVSALLLSALTFVVYSGGLKNDFIGWDDVFYVFENPYLTPLSPAMIGGMFTHTHFKSYTPLTLLSHAVDYRLWGLDPRGHHLTSILIHCGNAVWVFLLGVIVFRRISGSPTSPPSELHILEGAAIAALFFAWHPLRVESVICVSSRKDVLSAFFLFPSLISYLHYAGSRGDPGSVRWYFISLVLFLISLLAKGSGMTFAGVLLLSDLWLEKGWGGWNRFWALLREKGPFLVIGAAAAVVTYYASQEGGTGEGLRAEAGVDRVSIGLYNLAFYVWKTVWPSELAALYSLPGARMFMIFVAAVPAVTVLTIWLWWRGRRSWCIVWCIYLISLLPMAGFVPSSIQVVANRYAYLATFPFALLLGGVLVSLKGSLSPGRSRLLSLAASLGAAGIVVSLAKCSAADVGNWRDAETVWRHTTAVSPRHALGYSQLGLALKDKGEYPGAIQSFNRALEIYPHFHEAMCNLAGVYLSMHDTVNAELWLRKANELSPRNHATYTNMGNVRMLEGRISDAIAFYRQSIAINPSAPVTTYDLGYALVVHGDVDEGLAMLRRATLLNPVYGDAYYMIATTLANQRNDLAGALEAYQQAARLGHVGSQRILAAMGVAW